VVTTSGTGHSIVDREFAKRRIDRHIVLRVSSFLGIGRLVASTQLISIVPRRLGEVLADQEQIRMFAPPYPITAVRRKTALACAISRGPGKRLAEELDRTSSCRVRGLTPMAAIVVGTDGKLDERLTLLCVG